MSAAQGIVSNEWATNHNASFKITNISDTCYISIWNSMEYSLENKSLQVSIDQNILTSSFHLQLIQYDSNHQSLKTVQVGVSSASQNPITLTDVTVEGVKYISIRIVRYGNDTILFLDNIIITETNP